jgi:hypothetical protein
LDLSGNDQVAFYADGVGTSTLKPWAILGGAFGVGVKRNVIDTYKFARRNDKSESDDIYGFGLSRGAFTIRVVIVDTARQCDRSPKATDRTFLLYFLPFTFPNMSIAMFNRIILAAVMLAISTAVSAAKDKPKKEECPTLDHQEIEDLLHKAPSCQRAGALFESCQFGASGDVSLGAIVTEKCEGDFLGKLDAAQRRAYDREQKRCQRKYAHEDGTHVPLV